MHLKPTRDIAAHLGEMKKQYPGKVLVALPSKPMTNSIMRKIN